MKTYDEILKYFVSDNEHRLNIQKPCKRGNYVMATNGYIGIRIPSHKVEGKYDENKEFPDLDKLIDAVEKYELPKLISIDQIHTVLSNLKMVEIFKECAVCKGDGEIECSECGYAYTCLDCGGTGDSNRKIGYDYDENYGIKIAVNVLNPRHVNLLLKVAMVNNSEVRLVSNEHKKILFTVDDIAIIMISVGKMLASAEIKI